MPCHMTQVNPPEILELAFGGAWKMGFWNPKKWSESRNHNAEVGKAAQARVARPRASILSGGLAQLLNGFADGVRVLRAGGLTQILLQLVGGARAVALLLVEARQLAVRLARLFIAHRGRAVKRLLRLVEGEGALVLRRLRTVGINRGCLLDEGRALRERVLRVRGVQARGLREDARRDGVLFLLHHDAREEVVDAVVLRVDAARLVEIFDSVVEAARPRELGGEDEARVEVVRENLDRVLVGGEGLSGLALARQSDAGLERLARRAGNVLHEVEAGARRAHAALRH